MWVLEVAFGVNKEIIKGGTKPLQIVGARGTYETLGYEVGLKLKDAIHHNISLLNKGVAVKEIERETIAHVINQIGRAHV